jgi:uncharacterized protein YjbI with pentapeptide repeats
MLNDRDGFKFDLETQRFIINRWETEIGKGVREEIIRGIINSVEIRGILDDYVLEHPKNLDPYGHPIYPKSEMKEGKFWVLTQDDLRGIQFYNADFSNTNSLPKKSLSYARFYNCDLSNTNLERTELSYATFEKCNLENSILAVSGGFNTQIINSNLTNSCLMQSGFIDCNFSGTDFTGTYFDNTLLKNIEIDSNTIFDSKLISNWRDKHISNKQKQELLRSIRIAFSNAELWDNMDEFLFEEKLANRKYTLWNNLKNDKSINGLLDWFSSWLIGFFFGYATKPTRVILTSISISFIYSVIYYFSEIPLKNNIEISFVESLYFSLTTFATLGYGDLSFNSIYPIMRLISTTEAWLGAIFIAIFVVTLSRKVFR